MATSSSPVNAVDEDGGQSVYLLRFDSTGAQKAGPAGATPRAVEVVFGWANADNDGLPGRRDPAAGHRLGPPGRQHRRRREARGRSASARRAEGTGRTDNDRYVVRLLAADGSRRPGLQRRQALHLPLGRHLRRQRPPRPASRPTARSSAPATPTSARPRQPRHPDPAQRPTARSTRTSAASSSRPRPATAVGLDAARRASPCSTRSSAMAASPSATPPPASATAATSPPATARATGEGVASTLGFKTTEAPDLVTFRVTGNALDTAWGNNGTQAIQSEGTGQPTAEDRGRGARRPAGRPHRPGRPLRRHRGGLRLRRRGPARHDARTATASSSWPPDASTRSSSAPRSRPTASASR